MLFCLCTFQQKNKKTLLSKMLITIDNKEVKIAQNFKHQLYKDALNNDQKQKEHTLPWCQNCTVFQLKWCVRRVKKFKTEILI